MATTTRSPAFQSCAAVWPSRLRAPSCSRLTSMICPANSWPKTAGGTIILAWAIIAITAGVMTDFDDAMAKWAEAANPFFAGASADLLSILPYAAICVLLYVVGRERARK